MVGRIWRTALQSLTGSTASCVRSLYGWVEPFDEAGRGVHPSANRITFWGREVLLSETTTRSTDSVGGNTRLLCVDTAARRNAKRRRWPKGRGVSGGHIGGCKACRAALPQDGYLKP